MFIVTQDGSRIVNMRQVMTLFIASDGRTIRAGFENGSASTMGEYEYPLAEVAIKMLANALKSGTETFFMPTNEAVKARAAANAKAGVHTEQHAANGAVIKRHGGS